MPAFRALARAFPDHERILAAPGALAPLVALLDAETRAATPPRRAVDRLVEVGELAPLPRELDGADVVVNLHGRGPQSHRLILAGRPGTVIWFAHPGVPESADGPGWRADEHETARWCRLLQAFGIAADPADLRLAPPAASALPWAPGATVIHPGAASAARRWPVERFAHVARAERAQGRTVVVTGSAAERPLADALARSAGLPADAIRAGTTDLAGLAAGIAHAGRIVCGDTGVAHLATAFGTPSVVLFGPTPPALWGPPPGSDRHRVLWAGGTGDPHGRRPDPGLLAIDVAAVLDALAALPDAATRAGASAEAAASAA